MDASEKQRTSVEKAAWPRDCSYFQRGGDRRRKRERCETVYSRPAACIFFRDRRDATVFPPEDALFLIATMRIDNVRLVYTGGPLWQTLVPWNIVMQRVVTDCPSFDLKSLCHAYTLFAECAG